MILSVSSLLGLIAVIFGAFIEHSLRQHITPEQLNALMTALRYNQLDAIIASAIGLALLSDRGVGRLYTLKWSGILFIIGTILFSISIYLSVWLNMSSLINIVPLGGITIMMAWILLIISGCLASKQQFTVNIKS